MGYIERLTQKYKTGAGSYKTSLNLTMLKNNLEAFSYALKNILKR